MKKLNKKQKIVEEVGTQGFILLVAGLVMFTMFSTLPSGLLMCISLLTIASAFGLLLVTTKLSNYYGAN